MAFYRNLPSKISRHYCFYQDRWTDYQSNIAIEAARRLLLSLSLPNGPGLSEHTSKVRIAEP